MHITLTLNKLKIDLEKKTYEVSFNVIFDISSLFFIVTLTY